MYIILYISPISVPWSLVSDASYISWESDVVYEPSFPCVWLVPSRIRGNALPFGMTLRMRSVTLEEPSSFAGDDWQTSNFDTAGMFRLVRACYGSCCAEPSSSLSTKILADKELTDALAVEAELQLESQKKEVWKAVCQGWPGTLAGPIAGRWSVVPRLSRPEPGSKTIRHVAVCQRRLGCMPFPRHVRIYSPR